MDIIISILVVLEWNYMFNKKNGLMPHNTINNC